MSRIIDYWPKPFLIQIITRNNNIEIFAGRPVLFFSTFYINQCVKKDVSGSPERVDFDIRLVNSILGQVKFFRNSNYRRTVINPAHQKSILYY